MTTRIRTLALGLTLASALSGSCAHAASFTEFDAPGAGTSSGQGTHVFGMNSKGDIVGDYTASDNSTHSFMRLRDGTFVSFTPNTNIFASGINQHRQTTGTVQDGTGVHGFIGAADGSTTTFDVRGADDTQGNAIGAKGDIAGDYDIENDGDSAHGFIRSKKGKVTTLDAPGAGMSVNQGTFPASINSHGAVGGYMIDGSNNRHGFISDAKGNITVFDAPSSVRTSGVVIDNHSNIAGSYRLTTSGSSHGFLRDKSGTFTTFDAPGAGTSANQGTFLRSLTNKGAMSGLMVDAGNVVHGYIRAKNGAFTSFDAPDAAQTANAGTTDTYIDNAGEAGGDYLDASGVSHGYIRTP